MCKIKLKGKVLKLQGLKWEHNQFVVSKHTVAERVFTVCHNVEGKGGKIFM